MHKLVANGARKKKGKKEREPSPGGRGKLTWLTAFKWRKKKKECPPANQKKNFYFTVKVAY